MSDVTGTMKVWSDATKSWEEVERAVVGLQGEDLLRFIRATRGMYLTNYGLIETYKAELDQRDIRDLRRPRKIN